MPRNDEYFLDRRKIDEADEKFDDKHYTYEFESLKEICNKLDDYDVKVRQGIKNYLTIRTVSILDKELKMILADLVDTYKISVPTALGEPDFKLSTEDAHFVKKNNISDGRILLSVNKGTTWLLGYTTNFKKLEGNFSRITGLNFFALFEMTVPHEYVKSIRNIFAERNDMIHQLKDEDTSSRGFT